MSSSLNQDHLTLYEREENFPLVERKNAELQAIGILQWEAVDEGESMPQELEITVHFYVDLIVKTLKAKHVIDIESAQNAIENRWNPVETAEEDAELEGKAFYMAVELVRTWLDDNETIRFEGSVLEFNETHDDRFRTQVGEKSEAYEGKYEAIEGKQKKEEQDIIDMLNLRCEVVIFDMMARNGYVNSNEVMAQLIGNEQDRIKIGRKTHQITLAHVDHGMKQLNKYLTGEKQF